VFVEFTSADIKDYERNLCTYLRPL